MSSATSRPSRGRVLVVEDNPLNMRLAREVLQLHGFETVPAYSGEEALRAVTERSFDIVLMDIQLPGLDGLEVTQRLKRDPRTGATPVLAVSALARPEDRERALAAGCDGYVTKPYTIKRLVEAVESQLAAVSQAVGS